MRLSILRSLVGLTSLLSTPLLAQAPGRLGVEATLGIAHRGDNSLLLATDGIQATVRAALPIHSGVRVVGSVSWTRLPELDRIQPSYCPFDIPCAAAATFPGLGMAGLGAGLQLVLPIGPLQLRVTGMAGGHWLYDHPSGVPGLAAGTEGGLGLALPIGSQLHLLFQGRLVHLFGKAGGAANSQQIGAGLAFN
jgi:hypothetical protein